MIRTYFWPSNTCDVEKWDTFINRAIDLQTEQFPTLEITSTQIRYGAATFHEKTSLEIEEHLSNNQFIPSIHFILVGAKDIQEEHRDTFPEKFIRLDLLARSSRTHVIAIIDAINPELNHLKLQLSSITNVEKTCTVVRNFATTKTDSNYIQPLNSDQRKLAKLTFSAISVMMTLRDTNKLTVEP